MTLNGQNVTLAEINKIHGARHKHFNEDRRKASAAKMPAAKMQINDSSLGIVSVT